MKIYISRNLQNTINQGKILLDSTKKKNAKIIKDLEIKNESLNTLLIQANQKTKRLEEDLKQALNKDNNNGNNNEEKENEVTKLKNKIDEYEINISKLNLDNKNLMEKIENMKKEQKKEYLQILNYKNSEIKSYGKVIEEYEEYFKNNNINIKDINGKNLKYNGNNNLDYEKIIENKDKIIKNLNAKINKLNNEYKTVYELNMLSQNNNHQFQELLNKNKELTTENKNYKLAILKATKKMNEAKKNNFYKNSQMNLINEKKELIKKLNEYKRKIIILKNKVNELYALIDKLKNRKYQTSTNNSNYKYCIDIYSNPSTPNQIKKMPIMNNRNNSYYNNPSMLNLKNGNKMVKNQISSYGNNDTYRNKNGLSNEELEIRQKESIDNYRKILSYLDQNMPNSNP